MRQPVHFVKSTTRCDGKKSTSLHFHSINSTLKCFGVSIRFIRSKVLQTKPVNIMSEEENIEEGTDKKKGKKVDYCEVEFEIGNIEFEAKGRSIVVERMFRMLLEKIEEGKLVAEFRLQDIDEEEEEEEEEELPPMEYFEESEESEYSSEDSSLDPPPAWDSLETDEPDVSDAEREELGLE